MTTIELRNKVIGKINQIDDELVLAEIYKLLDDNFVDTETYQLSDSHNRAIEVSLNQIKNGEYLTNEEANLEIKKWLNK